MAPRQWMVLRRSVLETRRTPYTSYSSHASSALIFGGTNSRGVARAPYLSVPLDKYEQGARTAHDSRQLRVLPATELHEAGAVLGPNGVLDESSPDPLLLWKRRAYGGRSSSPPYHEGARDQDHANSSKDLGILGERPCRVQEDYMQRLPSGRLDGPIHGSGGEASSGHQKTSHADLIQVPNMMGLAPCSHLTNAIPHGSDWSPVSNVPNRVKKLSIRIGTPSQTSLNISQAIQPRKLPRTAQKETPAAQPQHPIPTEDHRDDEA
ncbi:hypothetical protein F5B20DRAFT_592864 [Whalleya microplaca]|nr:hypothetical protein F5B20DRAFT_592864 [Whalleya microplaca]